MKEQLQPLETVEWSNLAQSLINNHMEPYDLISKPLDELSSKLGLDDNMIQRMGNLISRSASISFELENLNHKGIKIVTRADENYPIVLKRKLGKNCPPLFYYAGDLELTNKPLMGIVGSRTIDSSDIDFTKSIVTKIVDHKMGIVSGGAKGIDNIASSEALIKGGFAVEYLSDSMLKKLKDNEVINYIIDGKLLLLSETHPTAGFNVGYAMKRNKYIYSNSQGTIIIKSDFNKGGTWTGAVESLKKQFTNTLCWNNSNYKGNIELIKMGASPIDENWNLKLESISNKNNKQSKPKQMSLFDFDK